MNPENVVFRTHTKTIFPSLLHEELKVIFGDKFLGIWTFPDETFKLLFDGALSSQEDADQNTAIQDHIPSSELVALKSMQDQKCAEGFDIYKKIIAHINKGGGFSSVDAGRAAYKAYLVPVRDMMKDGFPEFAYREIVMDIAPASILPVADVDLYKTWIKEFGMKYMTPEIVFTLLESSALGDI